MPREMAVVVRLPDPDLFDDVQTAAFAIVMR